MMHELLQAVNFVGRLVNRLVEREDNAVLEVLCGRENVFRLLKVNDEATGVLLISRVLNGRDPNRIHNSLLRLEQNDKVHRVAGGWRLGPIPHRVELVLKFAHS